MPAVNQLDLTRPSPTAVEVAPKSIIKTLIADAAKAFLFEHRKHNGKWMIPDLIHFLPTSRDAERIFSFCKEYLDRNGELRVEVLNALLCLHDIPTEELAKMWQLYWDESIPARAAAALKACPKMEEVDAHYLEKLKNRVAENEQNLGEKEKKGRILEILKEMGVLRQEEGRYLKRDLVQALGDQLQGHKELKKTHLEDVLMGRKLLD